MSRLNYCMIWYQQWIDVLNRAKAFKRGCSERPLRHSEPVYEQLNVNRQSLCAISWLVKDDWKWIDLNIFQDPEVKFPVFRKFLNTLTQPRFSFSSLTLGSKVRDGQIVVFIKTWILKIYFFNIVPFIKSWRKKLRYLPLSFEHFSMNKSISSAYL